MLRWAKKDISNFICEHITIIYKYKLFLVRPIVINNTIKGVISVDKILSVLTFNIKLLTLTKIRYHIIKAARQFQLDLLKIFLLLGSFS